jgi:hypothetical protein
MATRLSNTSECFVQLPVLVNILCPVPSKFEAFVFDSESQRQESVCRPQLLLKSRDVVLLRPQHLYCLQTLLRASP